MRKYLLSTSALAGAALLSSAAVADVSISGNFEWDYQSRDSNIAANDGNIMVDEQEVNVAFTNKTDSGLTITAQNQFKTSTGAQDDVSASVSGGFGKITMGKTDGANANYEMNAMGLVQEEDTGTLKTTTAGTTATIAVNTGGGGGNNSQVSYHLPAMGGLTAGISVGTGSIAKNNEFTAFGFKYAMEAGGAAITLGYSTKTTETSAADDNDKTSMGVGIVVGATKLTVSQGNTETATADETATAMAVSYDLGNGLVVSAGVVSSEDDKDAGEEYDMTTYEAAYTIASGLSAVLNVSEFDYENGTGSSSVSSNDYNGTTTSLSIKATF
jgi:phage tail tube protein FII